MVDQEITPPRVYDTSEGKQSSNDLEETATSKDRKKVLAKRNHAETNSRTPTRSQIRKLQENSKSHTESKRQNRGDVEPIFGKWWNIQKVPASHKDWTRAI